MTAQQQLVEFIGESMRHYSTWEKERLARVFLRDHGHAIAALIGSFAEEREAIDAIRKWEREQSDRREGRDPGYSPPLLAALRLVMEKRAAALRKLTQDA